MYRLATVFGLTAVPPFPTGFVGCAIYSLFSIALGKVLLVQASKAQLSHVSADVSTSFCHQPLPNRNHGYSLFRALLIVSNQQAFPVLVRFGVLR